MFSEKFPCEIRNFWRQIFAFDTHIYKNIFLQVVDHRIQRDQALWAFQLLPPFTNSHEVILAFHRKVIQFKYLLIKAFYAYTTLYPSVQKTLQLSFLAHSASAKILLSLNHSKDMLPRRSEKFIRSPFDKTDSILCPRFTSMMAIKGDEILRGSRFFCVHTSRVSSKS